MDESLQTLNMTGARETSITPAARRRFPMNITSRSLEAGVMCGPAKLAFMFASSGGSALNNNNPTKNYTGNCINNITTDNYNYLLFHNYGGGNDAPWKSLVNFTQDEVGQMQDAVALAARLDYAVAANLNIWGSYMWATRAEQNGWLAGSKNADGVLLRPAQWGPADAQAWKATAYARRRLRPSG